MTALILFNFFLFFFCLEGCFYGVRCLVIALVSFEYPCQVFLSVGYFVDELKLNLRN